MVQCWAGSVRWPAAPIEHSVEEGLAIARLPTSYDLSQPANLRSGRQIASADTSGIGRGLAALGGAIEGIGADIAKQRDTVDLARAEAYKTQGFIDAENEFSQDGDYSTFSKRAPERTGGVINKAAELIRDPKMRERWLLGAQTDAARANDSIADRGRALGKQAETVAFDDALEVNRRIYVDPETSEAAKSKARQDIEGAISTAEQSGLLTPGEAANRRDQYVKNADFSRAKLAVERDPNIINVPLPAKVADRSSMAMRYFQSRGWSKEQAAGIIGNLLAESSLSTGARNSGDGRDGSDSIGIGQWNSDRAKALKDFAALNRADWRDFGIQLAFVDHELRTNEKAAGDALRNAKDITGATEAMIMYERPAGSQSGARNAHNYQGRVKFAHQAAGEQIDPDWFQRLSPEERQIVYNQAETRQRQMAVEQRGEIETVVQNAPVAIQNTGTYDGYVPTRQQFVEAYGPEEGGDRFNKFSSALEVSQQAFDFRTMSSADIEAAVNAAQPVSSGDSAALETARYDSLSRAAAQTLSARNADPATYARQAFPNVDRAWQEAEGTGNYQAAMTATANAQKQLGVANMRLMPKAVADQAVTRFKDPNAPEQDRIGSITGLVFSTQNQEQQQAVFEQLVDAGLPDTTEGAIDAYARGDTGAGRRLMEAAIIDPSKLPGTTNVKPSEIDASIQARIMDDGQVGDVFYGLADGTVENQERAIRDSKLLTNAVNIRIRNGETLAAAVDAAAKDLYGDVKPVTGNFDVNAQVLVPADVDPAPLLDGFAGLLPTVRTELESSMAVPEGIAMQGGEKAITEAVRTNYIDNVLAQGYFRNSGNGYVFIDPFVGAAIVGPNGQPRIYSEAEVIGAQRPAASVPSPDFEDIPQTRIQTPQEVQQSEYGKFAPMLNEIEGN